MDRYFAVFDIAKVGVVKELNWNSVDCDECWWKGSNELEDLRESYGLLQMMNKW